MTASASVNEEAHGINAPGRRPTCPFRIGMTANRPSSNRIGPSSAVINKLLAVNADPNHTFPGREARTWEISAE